MEPGIDVVQPGDTQRVLDVLTYEFETWQDLTEKLSVVHGSFNSDRFWKVVRALEAEGRVDHRGISVKLAGNPPVDNSDLDELLDF
jgi:hypothetical protein